MVRKFCQPNKYEAVHFEWSFLLVVLSEKPCNPNGGSVLLTKWNRQRFMKYLHQFKARGPGSGSAISSSVCRGATCNAGTAIRRPLSRPLTTWNSPASSPLLDPRHPATRSPILFQPRGFPNSVRASSSRDRPVPPSA